MSRPGMPRWQVHVGVAAAVAGGVLLVLAGQLHKPMGPVEVVSLALLVGGLILARLYW